MNFSSGLPRIQSHLSRGERSARSPRVSGFFPSTDRNPSPQPSPKGERGTLPPAAVTTRKNGISDAEFHNGAVEIAYLDEGEGKPILLVHR